MGNETCASSCVCLSLAVSFHLFLQLFSLCLDKAGDGWSVTHHFQSLLCTVGCWVKVVRGVEQWHCSRLPHGLMLTLPATPDAPQSYTLARNLSCILTAPPPSCSLSLNLFSFLLWPFIQSNILASGALSLKQCINQKTLWSLNDSRRNWKLIAAGSWGKLTHESVH